LASIENCVVRNPLGAETAGRLAPPRGNAG
jgi:hypothetical protein